jgi:hypothetical protein
VDTRAAIAQAGRGLHVFSVSPSAMVFDEMLDDRSSVYPPATPLAFFGIAVYRLGWSWGDTRWDDGRRKSQPYLRDVCGS